MKEFRKGSFFTSDKKSSREMLKKTLRVIQGGKRIWSDQFDKQGLESDPFLREHFLEGRTTSESQPSYSLSDRWHYLLLGNPNELPPDAG